MKKLLLIAVTVLLALSMLCGCSKTQTNTPAVTEPSTSPAEPVTPPAGETTPAETEGDTEYEGNDFSDFIDAAYTQQIERYYTAISEQWDEGAYFDHEMSALAAYYGYEGNALDNVGFICKDLNGDDVRELIIGAIQNAERDPLVFEIWTLQNDEPMMLVQSGSRNRYYLQYAEEDDVWTIANEAENGAANNAVYYLQLSDGKLEVVQGIVFDAVANEKEPCFMAYDLDWDTSNDMSIDEDMANAITEAGRNIYTPAEYLPYSLYK